MNKEATANLEVTKCWRSFFNILKVREQRVKWEKSARINGCP